MTKADMILKKLSNLEYMVQRLLDSNNECGFGVDNDKPHLTYNTHNNQQQVLNNLHQMIGSMINSNTHGTTHLNGEKIIKDEIVADCTINADFIQIPDTKPCLPTQPYPTRPCCTTINLNIPLITPPPPITVHSRPKLSMYSTTQHENHKYNKLKKSNEATIHEEEEGDNDDNKKEEQQACFGKEEYHDQLFGFTNSNEFFNDLTDMK